MNHDQKSRATTRAAIINELLESKGWTDYLLPSLKEHRETLINRLIRGKNLDDVPGMRAQIELLDTLILMPDRDYAHNRTLANRPN